MAIEPKSLEAFQFVFEVSRMKELLNTNPKRIVCTVSFVEELNHEHEENEKPVALKIIATGIYPEGQVAGLVIEGTSKP